MKINVVRSDEVYRKMAAAPAEKRADIFRWELMGPFKKRWDLCSVPLKASKPGGYDVVMACSMLGLLPPESVDGSAQEKIALISKKELWDACGDVVLDSLKRFKKAGCPLPVEEYTVSIFLADPASPYTKASRGYFGDGGIPGFMFLAVDPGDFVLDRIPAALAHECNHNVRFQNVAWRNDAALADLLVCEGIAEVFAASVHGEDKIGPWVTSTGEAELEEVVKPLLARDLDARGFENITPLLYGDEIAAARGYEPRGHPFCAGYACGYAMMKYYIGKTGKSALEATVAPTQEIMRAVEGFWR